LTTSGKARLLSILHNTGWMMLDKFYRLGLAFVIGAIVARYLGPDEYGRLNFAASFLGVFSGISMMGIDRIIIRDLSKNPDDEPRIIQSLLFLKILALSVTLLAGFALAVGLNVDDKEVLLMIVLLGSGGLVQFGDILDLSFQARLDVKKSIPARLVGTTLSTGLKVVFVYLGFGVVTFAAIGLVEGASVSAIIFYAYKASRGRWPNIRPDWVYCKSILSESWPLFVALNFDVFYQRYYAIAVGKLMGPKEVAFFGLATRLLEIVLMLMILGTASFLPELARLHALSLREYHRKLGMLTEGWTLATMLVAVVALFVTEPMINLVFSSKYQAAAPIFKWMMIVAIFQANGAFRAMHCTIVGNTKVLLYYNILSLILSFGVSYMLIPRWGANGAAMSMAIVCALNYFFMSYLFPSTRDFFFIQVKSFLPLHLPSMIGKLIASPKVDE
jgi:O-antigen/teichoic acid export membrane protein